LIRAKVEMLLNERFPKLAPWGQTARSWGSVLLNKFKNEQNDYGIASKHIDKKGQVCHNGLTLVEVLNVGVALAPAGVGGLASDATLQPCSVSAATGRSICSLSLGESRKRPRAEDDASGNGENFEEDVQALIACTAALSRSIRQACGCVSQTHDYNNIYIYNIYRSCKMGLNCEKKAAQVSKSVLFG
tara:strand:+ start:127 stop:690 length:564 start_codon:yes stop_codon:yes gene_type:complete